MSDEAVAVVETSQSHCAMCRRSVLIGEPLIPFHDPKADRAQSICELCRARARSRGWSETGDPVRRGVQTKLRVEFAARAETPEADEPATLDAPQAAILDRATGGDAAQPHQPAPAVVERIRKQDIELARLRSEVDPARRAQELRAFQQLRAEVGSLRESITERDGLIERLKRARHAETSPMRMAGFALDAFNQSTDLERMARIARTLGDPIVNVHDEGPGIPRRVRLTMCWEIAWYEFTIKVDLGAGRASVTETGTGGDPSVLDSDRRRGNARWSGSGLKLS